MTEEQQGTNATPKDETTETTSRTTSSRTRRSKSTAAKESSALSIKSKHSGGLELLPTPEGLPSNRPIEASKLHIVSTYGALGGTRPIGASLMEVSGSLTISGNRPIALSHLKISELYSGNRPVASNEIDDPSTLMGYLD
jgi:hypothetical protein